MAITYKRNDDLEKMLEEFASFDNLTSTEFPNRSVKDKQPSKEENKK